MLGRGRLYPVVCTEPVGAKPAISHLGITPAITGAARFIASHYRVSPARAFDIAETAFRVSREHHINPYLVLAVIAVESSFRPHVVNRYGGAYGLMQIAAQVHVQRVAAAGGLKKLVRIAPNIRLGVALLVRYGARGASRVRHALWRYSGGEYGYAERVLALSTRLRERAQML
ncbi:MAG: transglycosylase SLT domain-containing protein [Steroidobacteraceae bacterium]